MIKGCSIRGAIKRGASAAPTDFSPFFFVALQGDSTNSSCYLLGLSDADPYRIILRKGLLFEGVPDFAPGSNGVLRRSTDTFSIVAADPPGTQQTNLGWHHLRLDVIVNLNSDVVLQVFKNDLGANPLGANPVWTPVAGMGSFTDDPLGINSGSAPLVGGRAGFGFASSAVTRRAFFDHLEVLRQI